MKSIFAAALSFLFTCSFLHTDAQDLCSPVGWATQNGGTTGGGTAGATVVSTYADLKTAITSSAVKVVHISGTITIPASGRINFQDQTSKTIIGLPGSKLVSADLTKDGSGILYVKRCSNIIFRNLTFEGPAAYDTDGWDNMTLDASTNIWIDHCEFQDGMDGNLDIKNISDYISVTWCKFIYKKAPIAGGSGGSDDHRFSNLFGSSDGATADRGTLRITLQNCWWAQGCKARMPRVRFGKVHVVNNLFNSTVASQCIMAGFEADLLVESNVFENVASPIDLMSNTFTAITARNNIFTNTSGNTTGSGTAFTPPYSLTVTPAANVKALVSAGAGATMTGPLSCSSTTPTNYTLTSTASPAAGGTITGAGSYTSGTVVTVTATPASGYTFSGWSGDASGTSTSTTVTMSANKTVTATFTPIVVNYTLTTTASPVAGGTISGAGSYTSGTVVTVTATPAIGYVFSSWSGSATGSTASTTVTMSSNKAVTATFAAAPNLLTIAFNTAANTAALLNPPYVSGVISDPTDPAKTKGIVVDVKDNGVAIAAANYSISGSSSNTSVVSNANIVFTKSSGQATIKITPSAVGYTIITITLTEGPNTKTIVINYAASAASATPAATYFHTGISDASAAIALDDTYFVTGDDELNSLYVHSRSASGLAVTSYNYAASLALPDGVAEEVDLEAGARSTTVSGRVYWIGSMGNGKSPNFNSKPNRNRIFATNISGTGAATTFSFAGYYTTLREKVIAWGDANGYNFTASAAAGHDAKIIDGFNVEGLTFGPDNTTLYIGMRAPLVPVGNRTKAVIVPVTNFETWFNNGSPSGSPTLAAPIELNLGSRGIRDLVRLSNGTYIIVAGSYDETQISALYKWSGNAADAPVALSSFNTGGLNLEAVMGINESGVLSQTKLQVITDNGSTVYYNDAIEAKDLTQNNFKKYRSDILTGNLATVNYTLTTTAAPAAGGTLSGAGSYSAGTTVTVTAIPATGYSFVSWIGDASGTSATTTVTMSTNKTVTANFQLIPPTTYTLTTAASPVAGGTISGAGTYTSGTVVTITATPAAGYSFVSWSGAVSGTSATTTVTMGGNKAVTATFQAIAPTTYTLTTTASPVAGGTISGAGTYISGTVVTIKATPSTGYSFVSWSGAVSGTSATTTVTMNANKSVTATFQAIAPTTYTLSTNASPIAGGTISGTGTYTSGAMVTVTATPNSGYSFVNWTGDASGSNATTTITMSGNKSATANFQLNSGGTSTIRIEDNATTSTGLCSFDGGLGSNGGASNGKIINLTNSAAKGISWKVNAATASAYTLNWRYVNSSSSNTFSMKLIVNGVTINAALPFLKTSSSSVFSNTTVVVNLLSGSNDIRLESTASNATADIDWLEITGNNPAAGNCVAARGIAPAVTSVNADQKASVYPNPANGKVTIGFYLPAADKITITILNGEGKVYDVIGGKLFSTGYHQQVYEVYGKNPRLYTIVIAGEKGMKQVLKLIVQ